MGALLRALAWAGQAAIGWAAGDIFNEVQRTEQATGTVDVPGAVTRTAKSRWWVWALGFVTVGAVVFAVILIVNVIRKK